MAHRADEQLFINAVHAALTSKNEIALVECVKSMKRAGMSQEEVYELLMGLRRDGTELPEDQDDVLCDLLDRVVGWCAQQSRLF